MLSIEIKPGDIIQVGNGLMGYVWLSGEKVRLYFEGDILVGRSHVAEELQAAQAELKEKIEYGRLKYQAKQAEHRP